MQRSISLVRFPTSITTSRLPGCDLHSTWRPTRHPLWRDGTSGPDIDPNLFTAADLERIVRAIVQPLDEGPRSAWRRLVLPAVLAMHQELRRKDELIEGQSLIAWLAAGWRQAFVLEHTPQPARRQ